MSNSNSFLKTFEHDVNVSSADKHACLKLLRTVVKNLSDPGKVHDEKFRQLRLSNNKIQSMTRHAVMIAYLQQTIGFQQVLQDGETILKMDSIPSQPAMSRAYTEVSAAFERVEASMPTTTTPPPNAAVVPSSQKKPLLKHSTSSVSTESMSSISSAGDPQQQQQQTTTTTALTEKQKARLLLEQKEIQEKEEARIARKRTSAQIKADKLVRQTDPNWKPSVSAAAAKTGTSMQTFRDKFGET